MGMLFAQEAWQEDLGGSKHISLADVSDVVEKPHNGKWELWILQILLYVVNLSSALHCFSEWN